METVFTRRREPAKPTSREMIIEAALTVFAERGTQAATLKNVADAAGVSVGRVQHHFKAKEDLIAAVDDHAIDALAAKIQNPDAPPEETLVAMGHRFTEVISEKPHVLEYICMQMLEPEGVGETIFDGMFAISEAQRVHFEKMGLTREDLDPEWGALLPLIVRAGTILFRKHIERHIPGAFLEPENLRRWDEAVTALIRHGQLRAVE
ncbi:helix-turn-helix domain-containing protein [Mycobacterium sp. SM3041]|uniref:TetR/AcrR family transcriptional regulator n=1 Tax=Mycobacterium sp. SM3041 TaxID=3114291 RepID=UPI003204C405